MKERMNRFSLYVPGATFIILGFLVVVFPMLLVALFSAALILLGITAISLAHRLRKLQRNSEWSMFQEPMNRTADESWQRVYVHRRW